MEIEEEIKLRNEKLIAGDLDWLIQQTGCPKELAEMILHKCRYDCLAVPTEMRHASGSWLRSHGLGAMGRELLPEGELP